MERRFFSTDGETRAAEAEAMCAEARGFPSVMEMRAFYAATPAERERMKREFRHRETRNAEAEELRRELAILRKRHVQAN